MAIENEDGTRPASETPDGNAGVSERSEREIEAGATGTGEPIEQDDSKDADEALDALAEADPKRAVVGLRKRLAKLTAQRNAARAEASERKALEARVAAYEQRERDVEKARRRAERETPEGQKAEERRHAVRQTIDETYGPGSSELLEELREERRLQKEQYALNGISHLRSELEDHAIPITDETLVRWERAVGSEMAEDPELLAAFRRPGTQQAAIKEAFNRVRDGLANPILKDRGAKPLERIERNRAAVLGGGRNRGAVAEAPEPEREFTPPAGLKGQALDQWWADVKQKEWARLSAAES